MKFRTKSRLLVGVITVSGLLIGGIGFAVPAEAAVPTGATSLSNSSSSQIATEGAQARSTALTVYDALDSAANPQATFNALSANDKAAFESYFLPATTVEKVTLTPLDSTAMHAVDTGAVALVYSSTEAASNAMAAAASGCWGNYVKSTAHAALGNAIWDTYTEGTWCYSGSTVTSATFSRSWSTIAAVGWRDSGQLGAGSGVVSNKAKIWSQRKMIFGSGGWDIQTQTPCLRMIGSASGGTTASSTCSIY
jgi:hypothetical protein